MGKDVKVYCSNLWSKEIAGTAHTFLSIVLITLKGSPSQMSIKEEAYIRYGVEENK
jgi:hypothetical protein